MSLVTQIAALATRVATEIKLLRAEMPEGLPTYSGTSTEVLVQGPGGTSWSVSPSLTGLSTSQDISVAGMTVGLGGGAGETNMAVGAGSLGMNGSGFGNCAAGANALSENVSGNYNCAIGYSALSVSAASDNTAVGTLAGLNLSSGNSNTFVGRSAGSSVTTGSSNTIVGRANGGSSLSSTIILSAGVNERARCDAAGNWGLGTSAPTAKLDITAASADPALKVTQLGGGYALIVEDSTSPDATPFVIDGEGRVGIGAVPNLPINIGDSTPTGVTMEGVLVSSDATPSGPVPMMSLRRCAPSGNPVFAQFTASGTAAAPSAVANGRALGRNEWYGYDGAAYRSAAAISVQTDAAPSAGSVPGRMMFFTTASGATNPAERVRITSSGDVGIGKTAPSAKLDVGGVVAAVAFSEGVFGVTGTAPALSPANGGIQTWSLTANSSPTIGTWTDGQSITLMVDDGSAYAITWPGVTWKTGGGTAPALNTTGYTVIALWKVGSAIYGARVGDA